MDNRTLKILTLVSIRPLLVGIIVLAGIHWTHHARAAEQVNLLQEIAGYRDDVINRGMVSFGGAGYLLVEGEFHVAGLRSERCVKLWKTNGVAGSAVIKSLCNTDGNLGYNTYPIPKKTWDIVRSTNPANEPVVLGDSFFFVIDEFYTEYDYKTYLWKSDGTVEGTVKVKEIGIPVKYDFMNAICVMGDTLYFLAGESLWRSDGTGPGTWKVLELSYPQKAYALIAYHDRLYIHIHNAEGKGEILVSNGRSGGTRVFLTDIGTYYPRMFVHDNALYFLADDHVHGQELWKTDGTYPGTHLVADINPGPGGSKITNFISLNGSLLFWASDSVFGNELWRTDGTREGTTRIKDIVPGPQGTKNLGLFSAALNDELYFNIQIDTGNSFHHQLWKTNGQEEGTVLIRDNLYAPSQGFTAETIVPADSAILGNKLYFHAAATPTVDQYLHNDGELWTTDGTARGTYQVKDIAPGNDPFYDHPLSSSPSEFITIGETVVFLAKYGYSVVPSGEYLDSKVGLFGVQQVGLRSHTPALPGIIRLLLSGN